MKIIRNILRGDRKDYPVVQMRKQGLGKCKPSSFFPLCLCISFLLLMLLPSLPCLRGVWVCSCVTKAKTQHTKGTHTLAFHKATQAPADAQPLCSGLDSLGPEPPANQKPWSVVSVSLMNKKWGNELIIT